MNRFRVQMGAGHGSESADRAHPSVGVPSANGAQDRTEGAEQRRARSVQTTQQWHMDQDKARQKQMGRYSRTKVLIRSTCSVGYG